MAGLGDPSPPRDPPKPFRSSTGLSLRERIKFTAPPRPQRPATWIRSPSLDDVQNQPDRPGISIPADSGVGLKARRMSASLPDDFHVDTCDLSEEFVSASRLPGRRGKEIGRGATATVKIMCRRGSPKDTHYAVKEFRKRGRNENEKEYEQKVKSEFSIANSLHHPNIVKTVRLCSSTGRWNHVMEYCCHGDLFSLVQRSSLQREDQMCLFKQLLHGVAYLHENGIAHRDIKLENLLLNCEGHLKITDFGVSEVFSGIHPGLRSSGGACGKEMGETRKCSPGICGSMPYISPEVLAKNGDYDPRPLDVWSSAIVCLALCFRGMPWQSAKPDDPNYAKFIASWDAFFKKNPDGCITETEYPSCGKLFSALHKEALRRLLLRMLHPNPEKRATMQEVLADRWMKVVECCCPEPGDLVRCVTCIDAAGKGSGKLASKMIVQKMHHHIPVDKRRRDVDET